MERNKTAATITCFNYLQTDCIVSKCSFSKDMDRITRHLDVWRTVNNRKGKFGSYNNYLTQNEALSTKDIWQRFLTESLYDQSELTSHNNQIIQNLFSRSENDNFHYQPFCSDKFEGRKTDNANKRSCSIYLGELIPVTVVSRLSGRESTNRIHMNNLWETAKEETKIKYQLTN